MNLDCVSLCLLPIKKGKYEHTEKGKRGLHFEELQMRGVVAGNGELEVLAWPGWNRVDVVQLKRALQDNFRVWVDNLDRHEVGQFL